MSELTLANVLDDSILVYIEDHGSFVSWIEHQTGGGSEQMNVDFKLRQITYVPKFHKREEIVVPIHLMGSVSESGSTWQWAWANEHFTETPLAEMSTRVRTFGESRGIPEIANGEHPINTEDEGPNALANYATKMAAVCCRIIGIPTAQVVPGGDMRAVMLVDPAGFAPTAPSALTFPRVLTTALSRGWIADHRRGVQGYAQARNMAYNWEPNFSALNLGFPEGNVRVAFDEAGLVEDINASTSA